MPDKDKSTIFYLQEKKNEFVDFYIGKDTISMKEFNDGKRSFKIMAKEKTGLFVKPGRFEYFISQPKNIKIFIKRGNNIKELEKDKKKIKETDKLIFDNLSFVLDEGYRVNSKLLIEVNNLSVCLKEKTILKTIGFQADRGDFVAIMGPSGCGKTTLLQELAGNNNRIGGDIRIDNQSIYENFHDKLKNRIGYVEQFDKIHQDLTVNQFLYFTAKIRKVPFHKERIIDVLKQLNLTNYRYFIIRKLSGGTIRKVSIAAELLDQPDIILLDEPTSPLDPQSIKIFLDTLKALAEEYNKLIIMVTHKPSDLKSVSKVIFLANGGYHVYFGEKQKFLIKDRAGKEEKVMIENESEILDIYEKFSEENEGKNYAQNFSKKFVVKNSEQNSYVKKYSFLGQLGFLTLRYLKVKFPKREGEIKWSKIKFKDIYDGWVKNLFNYLLQPVLVGLLFFSFPFFNATCLFLIVLAVIWFGINNSCKEIVEEIHIYKRERGYNLKIHAYLLSKIAVLLVISLGQIAVLLLMIRLKFHRENNMSIYLYRLRPSFVFLSLLSFSSITLGLLLSTISSKVEKVLIWVPIVLMAQIVFAGLVNKPDKTFKENISYFMLSRWGLEGLSRIQDSKAPLGKKTIKYHFTPIKSLKEQIRDSTIKYHKGIVVDGKPADPPNDTLRNDTVSARQALAAYNIKQKRDKLAPWYYFNSIRRNYVIIGFHGVLAYILCCMVLFKLDFIPYNKILIPSNINIFFYMILLSAFAFICLSPAYKKAQIIKDEDLEKGWKSDHDWYLKQKGHIPDDYYTKKH